MSQRARIQSMFVLLAAALAGGCTAPVEGESASSGVPDAGSSGESGEAEARTLDTCATTIAADVPAFYKKFFRCVDISMSGADVVIKTQDLPPHKTPYYPKTDPNWTAFDTQGGTRFQNPNTLRAQAMTMTVVANPTPRGLTIDKTLVDGMAGNPAEYHFKEGATGGVSLDGVAMFHGVAAPGDNLAQQAHTFDADEGHPDMTGAYHYHGASPGPLTVLEAAGLVTNTKPGAAEAELYAIMCDGTLVLGCTELDGSAPDSKDFDAQNGHVHDIAEGGAVHFKQRYHTHVCPSQFPGDPFSPEIQYYSRCGS